MVGAGFPSDIHRVYDSHVARSDALIQVLVAPELAQWVRSRAALDGLQVSGWVRQLIHRERLRLVVEAWWLPPMSAAPKKLKDPVFKLERLGAMANSIEFKLLTDVGEPVTDSILQEKHCAMKAELFVGHFLLRGDPRPWAVLHAFADADEENGMRLTMEPKADRGTR
jgi:hypothetical protein